MLNNFVYYSCQNLWLLKFHIILVFRLESHTITLLGPPNYRQGKEQDYRFSCQRRPNFSASFEIYCNSLLWGLLCNFVYCCHKKFQLLNLYMILIFWLGLHTIALHGPPNYWQGKEQDCAFPSQSGQIFLIFWN